MLASVMVGRKPDKRWERLRALGPEFTTSEATKIGLSGAVLTQAVGRGQIDRIKRGRYRFVDRKPGGPTQRSKRTSPTRAPLVWLKFENFGVFADAEFNFCPGINVLIGENGTGKSHAMQAAYSILRAFHKDDSRHGVAARVAEKLRGVFQPDDRRLSRLVQRVPGGSSAKISVESGAFSCVVQFNNKTDDSFELLDLRRRPTGSSIFIPSREVLAMYEGFIGAYSTSELSFSEVYFDTCVALNAPLARGVRKEAVASLLRPLLRALGGRVYESQGRFYVQQGRARLEAHLVSEGLRKLGTLVHLVNNGSLKKNDVLFWDEPEANLNPALARVVVDFLLALAKQGVQVVLATHDYAMTTRLSLLAENEVIPKNTLRFFSLTKTPSGKNRGSMEVSHADVLAELPSNPILDEHVALYDLELTGGVE